MVLGIFYFVPLRPIINHNEMKRLSLLSTIAAILMSMNVSAQTVVKGHVVNERNESVEYVSIGFEEDSVGVISDAKGYFTLTIPKGRKKELAFSHVSYLTTEVPYQEYASGKELTVVLKDKVIELQEVVIGKKNKPKTIVGKGVPLPGGVIGMGGDGSSSAVEGGITFSCSKNYVISDILLNVAECTWKECTLSFNLYEKINGKYVNILQKPIYEVLQKRKESYTLDVRPEERLLLKRNSDYYLSLSIVDGDGSGFLYLKAYLRNGLYRQTVKGKQKKLPVRPAMQIKGYEVE